MSEEEQEKLRAGFLLAFDPPEHTWLRRMLAPEFTIRRMRRLEPRIAEIVEAALDDLERAGKPADLVAHFALPVRENRAYMAGLVARAQADPGEDMLGMLVREHGDDLSTDELIGIPGAAGHLRR